MPNRLWPEVFFLVFALEFEGFFLLLNWSFLSKLCMFFVCMVVSGMWRNQWCFVCAVLELLKQCWSAKRVSLCCSSGLLSSLLVNSSVPPWKLRQRREEHVWKNRWLIWLKIDPLFYFTYRIVDSHAMAQSISKLDLEAAVFDRLWSGFILGLKPGLNDSGTLINGHKLTCSNPYILWISFICMEMSHSLHENLYNVVGAFWLVLCAQIVHIPVGEGFINWCNLSCHVGCSDGIEIPRHFTGNWD